MGALTQKKISISREQEKFLKSYQQWGFSDQSSIIREALDRLQKDLKAKRRKVMIAQKAQELFTDYSQNKELTAFTSLDGEDFK